MNYFLFGVRKLSVTQTTLNLYRRYGAVVFIESVQNGLLSTREQIRRTCNSDTRDPTNWTIKFTSKSISSPEFRVFRTLRFASDLFFKKVKNFR